MNLVAFFESRFPVHVSLVIFLCQFVMVAIYLILYVYLNLIVVICIVVLM